jgi:hypothetical protein
MPYIYLNRLAVNMTTGGPSMSIKFIGRYRPQGFIKITRAYRPPAVANPPQWETPSGLIGVWNENDNIDFALIASDPNGDIQSYALQSGTLPSGVSLNTISGHLLGTIGQVGQDTTYTFTARVIDKTGLFADQQFNLVVKDTGTMVAWQTPSGSLGAGDSGADYSKQVKATSNG